MPAVWAVAAGFVIIASLLHLAEGGLLHPNLADVHSYQAGARAVLSMHSPYSAMQLAGPYPLHEIAGGNGFVYPPTAAYLLVPLLIDGAPYVWNVLNVAVFAAVALAIVRREWGTLSNAGWLVAAAIILSQPGLYEVREGQMSPLIAASVGAMWLWPRQSGYLAVAGALFKVYPVAGLLWTARKRGSIVRPVLLALAIGATVPILNFSLYGEWITSLANARAGCPEWSLPSFSCAGAGWLGYPVAAALLLAAWFVHRDDVAFGLLGLAMIAPAPDLYWGYLLVPFICALPLLVKVARHVSDRVFAWIGPSPSVAASREA
jgi:hypothetical protein